MTAKAIVQTINNDTVMLRCPTGEACGACAGHSICKVKEREFPALNPNGFELSPGDCVDYEIPQGKTIFASFLLLVLPLLLFIGFYLLTGLIFKGAGEGPKALSGGFGLVLGFVISFIYGKLRPSLPIISSKSE